MSTVETYRPRRRYIPQPAFFVAFLILVMIPTILLGTLAYWWLALPFFILMVGGVLLQGLVNIPAAPPNRGVPTFLGERYLRTLGEGWHIRLGYDFLYGVIAVKVERVNLDFVPENVRTPDAAELAVPISITYTPTQENLLAFLNSGGETGVANILRDVASEAIREWASAIDRGPQSWREAYQAHAEAIRVVMNALAGRATRARLTQADLALMRAGNGRLESVALGITLNRVNITEIKVLGGLVEAAEKQAIETAQRAGEEIERDFLKESIEKLTDAGLTPEIARRAFQVERGKISETVQTKVFGVTPETFVAIGDAITKARGRGGKRRRP